MCGCVLLAFECCDIPSSESAVILIMSSVLSTKASNMLFFHRHSMCTSTENNYSDAFESSSYLYHDWRLSSGKSGYRNTHVNRFIIWWCNQFEIETSNLRQGYVIVQRNGAIKLISGTNLWLIILISGKRVWLSSCSWFGTQILLNLNPWLNSYVKTLPDSVGNGYLRKITFARYIHIIQGHIGLKDCNYCWTEKWSYEIIRLYSQFGFR